MILVRALGALLLSAALVAPTQAVGAAPSAAPSAAPAAAPAAAPVAAASAPAARAGATRTFLVHNVAGRLENRGRIDPVAAETVRTVRQRSPYAGALQEVCAKQAAAIDRRLAGYRVVFFDTGVRCEGDQAFGNAVLIRNGSVARRSFDLPGPGNRIVGCVTRSADRAAVCSTHLTADRERGAERLRQAQRVAQVSRGFVSRGFATFTGGDFNDTPATRTLNPLYRPAYGGSAYGIFTEANGCCGRDGDHTLGTAKFDYGFFSRAWQHRRGFVSPSASSDHDRLWTVLRRR